jgi:hypothetical protein
MMKRIVFVVLFVAAALQSWSQITREQALQRLESAETKKEAAVENVKVKTSTRLFGSKDDLTTVLLIIPSGTEVEVTGSDSTYFAVAYDGYNGYIFRRHAEVIKEPAVKKMAATNNQAAQNNAENAGENESRFTYLEKKYGTNIAARLSAGKIWKGMTANMVRDSWGEPGKINKSESANSLREEWIYRNTWLYMENNILTDWGPIKR